VLAVKQGVDEVVGDSLSTIECYGVLLLVYARGCYPRPLLLRSAPGGEVMKSVKAIGIQIELQLRG
jgi:hypothetical protein